MKPIKLKIKGLNSFREEQTIDFDTLTSRGLFGIFGPTGSGKSTILDGITLALYGDVARKSNNYINTNDEAAYVSYEFQISGAMPKRYRVEREFKRDKNTGNPRTAKAKVVELTTGEPEVLAEGPGSVTSLSKEIIGLDLQDFTRTVVLPQGKFSEFLKLEGVKRREMLERLFHLEKYGDKLSLKLSNKVATFKEKSNVLEGQLSGYEQVSQSALEQKQQGLAAARAELHGAELECKELYEEFLIKKNIRELCEQLLAQRLQEEELKAQKEEISKQEEVLKRAEAAEQVMPFLQTYENLVEQVEEAKNQELILAETLNKATIEKNQAEENFVRAQQEKEQNLSRLQLELERAKEAQLEKQALEELTKQQAAYLKEQTLCEETIAKGQTKLQQLTIEKQKLKDLVLEEEKKLEELKTPSSFKEKVESGVQLSKQGNESHKQRKQLEERKLQLEKDLLRLKEVLHKESTEAQEEILRLEELKTKLRELEKNPPGDRKELLLIQKRLTDTETAYKEYERLTKGVQEEEARISESAKIRKELALVEATGKDKLLHLQEKGREFELQGLAVKLRENLREHEVCPVCGSLEHHREHLPAIEESPREQTFTQQIEEETKTLAKVTEQLTRAHAQLDIATKNQEALKEQLQALGTDFKVYTVSHLQQELQTLDVRITTYEEEKKRLENQIEEVSKQTHEAEKRVEILKAQGKEKEEQLVICSNDFLEVDREFEKIKEEILELTAETKINNFIETKQLILKKEESQEQVAKLLKQQREQLEGQEEQTNSLKEQLSVNQQSLAGLRSTLEALQKSRKEKLESLQKKVSDYEKIPQLMAGLQNEISQITERLRVTEEAKRVGEENLKAITQRYTSHQGILKQREASLVDQEALLKQQLKEQDFDTKEQVKLQRLDLQTRTAIKNRLQDYQESCVKLKGSIEGVLTQLDGRSLTEEEFVAFQEMREEKEKQKRLFQERKYKLEEEVKTLLENLAKLKDLLAEQEKVDHTLALLKDLEKLCKGKRFVEFVAVARLQYLSKEASERLLEISNGTYALEADATGKFIIRDNKNGGKPRDASTLSGGETFLASLALALALSTEIQLKGTAPLELFFLDEGFGTLDDELLDVVMDSLEKIHNDKLKVGLISHVESIKNRVPVKLLVTPAISGKGGSKVSIQRN